MRVFEVRLMVWTMRSCFRCHGDVFEDEDGRRCLQCGRDQSQESQTAQRAPAATRTILAVDPGQTCGYAVVVWSEHEGARVVDYGEIPVLGTGIEALTDAVQRWARRMFDNVDHVAWEGPIYGARSRIEPHEVRGVLRACCLATEKPHSQYSPSLVKQTLTGNGRASKAAVAHAVRALFDLPRLPTNHVSDALAVAVTHLVHGEEVDLHVPLARPQPQSTSERRSHHGARRRPGAGTTH
jgi:crossover junction endodeoxyribonuclease RuvC